MSSFITIALTHDAVCPKGEEWMFHSLPKTSNGSILTKNDNVEVLEEGRDYKMVDCSRNEKSAIGILVLAALLAVGGLIAVVSFFIKHA